MASDDGASHGASCTCTVASTRSSRTQCPVPRDARPRAAGLPPPSHRAVGLRYLSPPRGAVCVAMA
jgi:hypothetical protein